MKKTALIAVVVLALFNLQLYSQPAPKAPPPKAPPKKEAPPSKKEPPRPAPKSIVLEGKIIIRGRGPDTRAYLETKNGKRYELDVRNPRSRISFRDLLRYEGERVEIKGDLHHGDFIDVFDVKRILPPPPPKPPRKDPPPPPKRNAPPPKR